MTFDRAGIAEKSNQATAMDDERTMESRQEEREDGSTDRLLYLSDGVFAIVITLLVLDLHVPHFDPTHPATTLAGALRGFLPLWPSLLGYVLSFVTVGIMWTNHCVLFRYIKRNDHLLTILNSALLLVIVFVPFATAVLAEYLPLPAPYPQAAVAVYTASSLVMAIAFNLLWRHASRDQRLLDPSVDPRMVQRVNDRYRFGPLIYAVCFGMSFVNVMVTLAIICGLTLLYALPYGKEAAAIEERLRRYRK